MSQLRRSIARYATWLEARAQRFKLFSIILTAVAHRLRQILENTEEPEQENQYGIQVGSTVRRIEALDDLPAGTKLYTRTATYTVWKEIGWK